MQFEQHPIDNAPFLHVFQICVMPLPIEFMIHSLLSSFLKMSLLRSIFLFNNKIGQPWLTKLNLIHL